MTDAPWPGAVAVSGGADSLALMLLLADWSRRAGRSAPVVLTVDHGLQPGSAAMAQAVLETAATAGLEAHRLRWRGAKPKSDLEAVARAARYQLMGTWCRRHGLGALYVAHTMEDQAETVLLRLARGSGLDGLAAMRPVAPVPEPGFEGLSLVRPLLGVARADLRALLEKRGVAWSEDPMNRDPRFARVRMRAAWPVLEEAGLSARRIADAATHLGRARAALEAETEAFLAAHARFEAGRALLDGAALAAAPCEIGLRSLAAALGRIAGAAYRPRFERLERLYRAILTGDVGKGRTLQGCRIGRAPKRHAVFGPATLLLVREPGRAQDKQG